MGPITGIGLILSLIPLYLRERDKKKAASKEDFYAWLLEHKFQDVKDCITNNYALEVEIADLLKMDHEELLSRLDGIDKQLACILDGIDCFRALAQTIAAPKPYLTKNQEELLRAMVSCGCTYLGLSRALNDIVYNSDVTTIDLSKVDEKFIIQSADVLANQGFLTRRAMRSNNNGYVYYLTEAGQDYIDSMDKIKTSNE